MPESETFYRSRDAGYAASRADTAAEQPNISRP